MPKPRNKPALSYKSSNSDSDFNLDDIYDYIFNDVYAIITEVDKQ